VYHRYVRRPLARNSFSSCYICSKIVYHSNSEKCPKCGGIAKVYPMDDIPTLERVPVNAFCEEVEDDTKTY
jgi:hypothetical protein